MKATFTTRDNRTLCAHCREPHGRGTGHVNRSIANGWLIFCGRVCSGLARRTYRDAETAKAEKRLYDMEYRRKNRAKLKAKKAAYYQRTRDPEKERERRKAKMPQHVEYCRQPRYRAWKREYDRHYRAKEYEAFADAYLLTVDLNREIKQRMKNHEIRLQNQTHNKRQERGRASGETPNRSHGNPRA